LPRDVRLFHKAGCHPRAAARYQRSAEPGAHRHPGHYDGKSSERGARKGHHCKQGSNNPDPPQQKNARQQRFQITASLIRGGRASTRDGQPHYKRSGKKSKSCNTQSAKQECGDDERYQRYTKNRQGQSN
jgi:hypothetical protein